MPDTNPTRALLAELIDALDRAHLALLADGWERLTRLQRDQLDAAWAVSLRARDHLGVPWPLDCVRPLPDPATTPSPE
jgi:hypothetical protein